MKRTKKSTEAKKKRRNATEMTRMMRTQAGQSQDHTQVVVHICVKLRFGLLQARKKRKRKRMAKPRARRQPQKSPVQIETPLAHGAKKGSGRLRSGAVTVLQPRQL